ncbi:phosphoribosyltransferase [Allokutzneria multivorans]|uniref:phosphoribosyltransferase n=1 Tax=Allokutzneria multivorans TaxID=1142134 RepID=UPI0031EAE2A5
MTYVRGDTAHQSVHTVRAYKRDPPAPRCAENLATMIAAATKIHGRCITESTGSPWEAITFVPSKNYPVTEHPVVGLARKAAGASIPGNQVLLELGPGIADKNRVVRDDRFVLSEQHRERVRGRHVLLIDDTWVTGAKIQSAAVTLRDAGASRVTALCVARWCKVGWADHKALLDSRTDPYDPFICPVSGKNCVER